MDKKALRIQAAARREKLCGGARDAAIAEAVLASPLMRYSRFFVYLAIRTEVKTEALIGALLRENKQVFVPHIADRRMEAYPYGPLVCGKFGILTPENGEDSPCEVALCPLLAFDKEGYRLGYGGGYYDAYFRAHPSVVRVGLSYCGQAVEALPHEPHDVPLDFVVTENGILSFPKKFV